MPYKNRITEEWFEGKNEDQDREFWGTHSPLDYLDSSSIRRSTFPNLKPSLKSISIRVPSDMPAELKTIANKKDLLYQRLAKVYLARQIALDRGSLRRSPRKKVNPRAHPPKSALTEAGAQRQ